MFEKDEEISDEVEGQESDPDDVEETADDEAEIESDDAESEEQSEEDQDLEEEEEEEEAQPAKAAASKFKTKDGDFNWKEINKAIGNGELEKSHKEAQQAVTKAYEEKKAAEVKVQQFGKKAELFDHFDQIYRQFPQVQQAIEAAMSGGRAPNMQQQLPQGVDPNDPVVPMLLQLQEVVGSLSNQSRQEQQRRQVEAEKGQFRQGLSEAQAEFQRLTGRKPTEDELRRVAGRMTETGFLDGATFVPRMFIEEIQKHTRSQFYKSRGQKKNLTKGASSARASTGTSKSTGLKAAFEAAIDETGFDI